MLSLLAERSFSYAGRTVHVGESFQPQSANDAIVLKVGGLAIDAPIPGGESDPELVVEKPKRTYRRRDVETSHDAD